MWWWIISPLPSREISHIKPSYWPCMINGYAHRPLCTRRGFLFCEPPSNTLNSGGIWYSFGCANMISSSERSMTCDERNIWKQLTEWSCTSDSDIVVPTNTGALYISSCMHKKCLKVNIKSLNVMILTVSVTLETSDCLVVASGGDIGPTDDPGLIGNSGQGCDRVVSSGDLPPGDVAGVGVGVSWTAGKGLETSLAKPTSKSATSATSAINLKFENTKLNATEGVHSSV